MSVRKTISFSLGFFCVCLSLLGVCSLARTRTLSQTPSINDTQMLAELLGELHATRNELQELKLAVQRSQSNLFQAQLTIDQRRLHQDQVNYLRQTIEQTRSDATNLSQNKARLSEIIGETENLINAERDSLQAAQLKQALRDYQDLLNKQAQQESSQRERETQLNVELEKEQARLTEINNQLSVLAREIEQQKKNR